MLFIYFFKSNTNEALVDKFDRRQSLNTSSTIVMTLRQRMRNSKPFVSYHFNSVGVQFQQTYSCMRQNKSIKTLLNKIMKSSLAELLVEIFKPAKMRKNKLYIPVDSTKCCHKPLNLDKFSSYACLSIVPSACRSRKDMSGQQTS